jgi:hypothetical protein
MPFIKFDDKGVCNYCNSYEETKLKNPEGLERILEKYRSAGGEPDCIVAFSGGRDSSYGLHYIKNILKMNPIAFTYDWGMVTDLARRNQARVCGKLGIKHIIISADIRRKRENIRKNVLAWLKKPELGMVTLFMAGDKHFYYHANKLRQKTGVKLVIFCENRLEKTDFKLGFCGVDTHKYTGKGMATVYTTGLLNKIQVAKYYAAQFMRNPAYLNSSLWDTLTAYLSTYFVKHDYLFLYEYIKWDEHHIVNTLINEYDWEIAKDTVTTWRIGDATAPFYNYIYYKFAGFSEHDTFLSNQIREGLITREEALSGAGSANAPRPESIRAYLDILGLDYDDVMKRINALARF